MKMHSAVKLTLAVSAMAAAAQGMAQMTPLQATIQ